LDCALAESSNCSKLVFAADFILSPSTSMAFRLWQGYSSKSLSYCMHYPSASYSLLYWCRIVSSHH